MADEVLNAMMPYFQRDFGNSFSTHPWGWATIEGIEKARSQVASLINAAKNEIYFTSGATESNNWVFQGLIEKFKSENPTDPIHVITSAVEHNSVLKALEHAQKTFGVEVEFAPINQYGQIEMGTLKKLIRPNTRLVSIVWVNNEIGSINPVKEIAELCHQNKIYFHSDATQAVGKIKVDLTEVPVDLLSFSGHKIYGPKGIGALYVRSKNPKVDINPIFWGGGHEHGLRSGTLNTPGIVGMGVACELAQNNLSFESDRLTNLRNLLWSEIKSAIPCACLNGDPNLRAPNNLNITFKGSKVPASIAGLGVSKGSACHSGGISTSHVLLAIGLSETDAANTIRISLGKYSSESHVKTIVSALAKAIQPTVASNDASV